MNPGVAEHFSRALQGEHCQVIGLGRPRPLPIGAWLREADADDLAMLRLCTGSTLDIGCGPGRMTAALAAQGRPVLGIDVVEQAVTETVRRGGSALRRDVHDVLPGEGRWDSALLADGNIGIGGDPVALLQRVGEVLAPAGRVVVEVGSPQMATFTLDLQLDIDGHTSHPFPWAFVGVDDIADIATRAGLQATSRHRIGERWCAIVEAT